MAKYRGLLTGVILALSLSAGAAFKFSEKGQQIEGTFVTIKSSNENSRGQYARLRL